MKCLGRSFQVDCEEVSARNQGSVGQDWEASDPQCKCISPFEGAHSWYCWSIARRILAAGWPTMNGCVRVEYLLTCAYKNIPKSTLLLQRHLTVGGFIRALLETQDTILTVELSQCWRCTIGWAAKWGLAKWPGAERLLVVDDGAAGSLTYGGGPGKSSNDVHLKQPLTREEVIAACCSHRPSSWWGFAEMGNAQKFAFSEICTPLSRSCQFKSTHCSCSSAPAFSLVHKLSTTITARRLPCTSYWLACKRGDVDFNIFASFTFLCDCLVEATFG